MEEKKKSSKKFIVIGVGILIVLVFITFNLMDSPKQESVNSTPTTPTTTTNTQSKEDAQKEFDRLMDLSKKSGLVTSYEVSEKVSLTIYVSQVWYTQTVQFKKDMIAKFSMLQQNIYDGRHRLEVKDAYSNEKVAEVTAFSGSLEVYK